MPDNNFSDMYKAMSTVAHDPIFFKGKFDEAIRLIIQRTAEVLNCDRVSAWDYKIIGNEKYISCIELWIRSTHEFSSGTELGEDDCYTYLNALERDAVLVMNDVETDPRCVELMQEYLPAHNIKSMLDAPFLYNGQLAGVLCAEHVGEFREWSMEEQHFIANMASLLSIAREREHSKQLERLLEKEKDRYQQLAYSSLEGIMVTVDNKIEFINPSLKQLAAEANLSITDIAGKKVADVLPEEQASIALQRTLKILGEKATLEPLEYEFPQPDGSTLYFEVSSKYVRWNGKDAIQSSIRNVTNTVNYRKKLERYTTQLRSIANSFPGGFTYIDREEIFREVNDIYASWHHAKKEDFIGKSFRIFLGKKNYEEILPNLEKLREGGSISLEGTLTEKGDNRPVQFTVVPDMDDKNTLQGYFTLITDLSNLKETEKALRQAQKMEAVGQLSGGIAHDFNNLLSVIIGNLELMLLDIPRGSPLESNLEYAMAASKRGAELTQKLLDFSRQSSSESETISINENINKMLYLINKSLASSISVELKLQEDIWPIMLNSGELSDAILNMSLNARDAMAEHNGTLTITTQNQTIDENDYVMLSMVDTGCGIEKSQLDFIFNPFYSTKGESNGSGLGLSMVYGFVIRSGGFIEVDSKVGKGTEFRLYFPRLQESENDRLTSDPKSSHQPKLQFGSETILIVDDEEPLLATIDSMLKKMGYKTHTANNPDAALKTLKEHPEIDLLFSDIVLGTEMDGYQLALKARISNSKLKILLTTGFNKSEWATEYSKQLPHSSILKKPYKMEDLALAIQDALTGKT